MSSSDEANTNATANPKTADAGATEGGATEGPTFTAKEEQTMKVLWQCMKTAPEFDIAMLTKLAGFKTEKTASNTLGVIKKKLGIGAIGKGASVAKKTTTSTAAKRPAEDDENDAGPGAESKPLAKMRTRATAGGAKANEAARVKTEDDEDAAET